MKMYLFGFYLLLAALLVSSCGGTDELASVNGEPITRSEYLTVFNNLPADMQVSVLEPGGRMDLMQQIVLKRLLLTAWREDTTVSDGWEELYRTSMLADSMFNRFGHSFDAAAYVDSITSCGIRGFSLTTVLVDDSAFAMEVAENWNRGDIDSLIPSISAPWSFADGSSFRRFGGPIERISNTFAPLLDMEYGVAHVFPAFGEWCVALLNVQEGERESTEGLANVGFPVYVERALDVLLLSRGVTSLAENCTVSDGRVVPVGEGSSEAVAILGGEDTLTVARILGIMRKADPTNFPGGDAGELSVFSPPELYISPELTMWMYADRVARTFALAGLAEKQNTVLPDDALDYARVEGVIRERVIKSSRPDSEYVSSWFEDHKELFVLPERRSVLLAYTQGDEEADSASISGFTDLTSVRTLVDSTGALVPTPFQVEQAFGRVLGPAVFSADSGVFTGPVPLEEEHFAWFEVVGIEPPVVPPLGVIYPQVEAAVKAELFTNGYDSLMEDLKEEYPVVIDTSAVQQVDLWEEIN